MGVQSRDRPCKPPQCGGRASASASAEQRVIDVLLVEDHPIVRRGLRALLDDEDDIRVIGEAGDGREGVTMAEALRPAVVMMDFSMPGLNGLEATRRIKRQDPGVKVLVLTRHTSAEHVFQALRAGASGYVVKKAAPSELVEAIRSLFRGEPFLSPGMSPPDLEEYVRRAETMEENRYDILTDRQREVLQLIAEGRSSAEIAQMLHVTERTVRAHRVHLMDRLGVHTIAELTQYAIRRGLVGADGS